MYECTSKRVRRRAHRAPESATQLRSDRASNNAAADERRAVLCSDADADGGAHAGPDDSVDGFSDGAAVAGAVGDAVRDANGQADGDAERDAK